MYEQPLDAFLINFYKSISKILNQIIDIKSKKSDTDNLIKIYEMKKRIIDALDYMCKYTDNSDIKKFYNTMGTLISSDETKKLILSLKMCEDLISKK
jgi:hypothetical protein